MPDASKSETEVRMNSLETRVAEPEAELAKRDAENRELRDRLAEDESAEAAEAFDLPKTIEDDENQMYLPLEVIGIIGSFLQPGSMTLARLASTSKQVQVVLAPSLYRIITTKTARKQKLPDWFLGSSADERARWTTHAKVTCGL
jgi:hypothetical protein